MSVHLLTFVEICFYFWEVQVVPVLLNNLADVGLHMNDLPVPSVVWSVYEVFLCCLVSKVWSVLIDSRLGMGSEV